MYKELYHGKELNIEMAHDFSAINIELIGDPCYTTIDISNLNKRIMERIHKKLGEYLNDTK